MRYRHGRRRNTGSSGSRRSACCRTGSQQGRNPVASTSATMPTAVADKYSKEAAGKGRLHTCLDQHNANKATNANGGLRWIQKGGGYYSICNAKLKG